MKKILLLSSLALLSGCNVFDRLRDVGRPPRMVPVSDPSNGYRNVQMPMPEENFTSYSNSNSLFRHDKKSFFKDQRAARVGDILTIAININDSASLKNKSTRKRTAKEEGGIPSLYGFEKVLKANMLDPSKLVNATSSNDSSGDGGITRSEQITTNISGVVTQILPNGNMVIMGRQEVRVNYELRQLQIAGVIRPEDIDPGTNTVPFEKIAEARVSYGGRGHLSDYQQERYGKQVLDVILPF